MPVDDDVTNPSSNRPFIDVMNTRFSRRTLMSGGAAAAAVSFFGSSVTDAASVGNGRTNRRRSRGPLLDFAATDNPGGPDPVISADYEWSVLIPWGSPLQPGGPDIAGGRPATAEEARAQIGAGHDGMWFFPINGSSNHGVLCINHEFGRNDTVLGASNGPETAEEVSISQAVHGMSVVEIMEIDGCWQPVASTLSRRITPSTAVSFDGPVAASPQLANPAANPFAGTVNNCGNGYTPWGTYLTCEENFNGYFGANGDFTPTEEQARYGFTDTGFGYRWHEHDPRFDLNDAAFANEANRFGWIVEVDPLNPTAPPMKHTALGRVKHEGIAIAEGRGKRIVGYMGDDQRFDYIYKFVSAKNWRSMRARGLSPLSEGQLYVARFNDDGSGDWLELTIDDPALAARFADQAELLTFTRIAADIVGATPMDRPEWTTVAPNGDVFCTLTNNSEREVPNTANPLAPNPDGHIIRWRDADQHVGTTFEWDIFVFGQDTLGTPFEFTDPDGLWADPDGRLFIETDGGQPNGNNQCLVADPSTGEIRRLFAGVTDDEITGVAVTPDRRTLFVNTQHPGNGDPQVTNFPVPGAGGTEIPRDATIVIRRRDGGIVGS